MKQKLQFKFLKSLKKAFGPGVVSGSGAESTSQRYGSVDTDPDTHQNVTYPQHWWRELRLKVVRYDKSLEDCPQKETLSDDKGVGVRY